MPAIPKKSASIHKKTIGLSIALSLLIIVTVGVWYWNTHKKKIIRKEIEKAITKKSNGLYNVKYDSLGIDELAGYISISNMNLVCRLLLEKKKINEKIIMNQLNLFYNN